MQGNFCHDARRGHLAATKAILLFSNLVSLLAIGAIHAQSDSTWLKLEKEIVLPGVEGRIDHLSVDIPGKRLFVAALGNGTIEVLDLTKNERTAQISRLEEPQGLYFNATANCLYVASGGDGTLRIYNGRNLVLDDKIELGDDADNVRGDVHAGQIFVGYGSGALAIATLTGQNLGRIVLGSHPESFQLEQSGSRVFVNVPKETAVAVVDRTKKMVVAKWDINGTSANYPMALDEAHRRLFVGCRTPPEIVIFDTDSGHLVAKLPVVGDTDDLFFDPARRLLYVIGGQGAVDIVQMRDPNHYEPVERIPTASGARTGLLVPDFDRLFVAAPRRGSRPARILVYQIAHRQPAATKQ
jgi:DNA-binding beta-propeller fold protein YncE